MARKTKYFYCLIDGEISKEFTSAYSEGTDGNYYMRKKGPAGEDIRYNPKTGCLEIGDRNFDNSWKVYTNQVYRLQTWIA